MNSWAFAARAACLDLGLGRVRLRDPEVFGDGAVEQVGVLGDDGDGLAERRQRDFADVAAADQDAAAVGIEEAQQQPDQGRLAGAARADDAERLAGLQGEGEVSQRLALARGVAEADALEADLGRERAGVGGAGGGLGGVDHLRLRVQDLVDRRRGRHRDHAPVVERDQLAERPEHLDAEHQDDQQNLQLQAALLDADGAPGQRDGRPGRDPEDGDAAGDDVGGQHEHRAAVQVAGTIGQEVALRAALPERLERRETLDAVDEVVAEGGVGVAAGESARAVQRVEEGRHDQREDGEDQEDQAGGQVQPGHEEEDDERRQGGDQQLRQVLPEERLQHLDAVDEAQGDAAGALLVDRPGPEREDVAVQLLAEPDLHLGAGLVGDVLFPDLDEPAPDDQHGDGDDHRDQIGDGLAANDAGEDDARERQSREVEGQAGQADQGGDQDPPAQALREREQSPVEIHARLLSTPRGAMSGKAVRAHGRVAGQEASCNTLQ